MVLGPEHAGNVARSGMSRRDARMFLYETARIAIDALGATDKFPRKTMAPWMLALGPEDGTVPVVGPLTTYFSA